MIHPHHIKFSVASEDHWLWVLTRPLDGNMVMQALVVSCLDEPPNQSSRQVVMENRLFLSVGPLKVAPTAWERLGNLGLDPRGV